MDRKKRPGQQRTGGGQEEETTHVKAEEPLVAGPVLALDSAVRLVQDLEQRRARERRHRRGDEAVAVLVLVLVVELHVVLRRTRVRRRGA